MVWIENESYKNDELVWAKYLYINSTVIFVVLFNSMCAAWRLKRHLIKNHTHCWKNKHQSCFNKLQNQKCVNIFIDFSVNFTQNLFAVKLLFAQQPLIKMQITMKTYQFTSSEMTRIYHVCVCDGKQIVFFPLSSTLLSFEWWFIKWLMQMHAIGMCRLEKRSMCTFTV